MAEAQETLTRAQRIAGMGNWDWRITENKLYWSDEIYRLFGIAAEEFGATYENFLAHIHPDDRQAVSDAVRSALEDGRALRHHPPDRAARRARSARCMKTPRSYATPSGAPVAHDRNRARCHRAASHRAGLARERGKAAHRDRGLSGRAVGDRRERACSCCRAVPDCKLLGLVTDQVVGKSVFDVYRDHPEVLEDTRRVLAGESFVSTRWIGKLAFEVRYSPLRDRGGALAGAVGVAADVTERKTSEDRLGVPRQLRPGHDAAEPAPVHGPARPRHAARRPQRCRRGAAVHRPGQLQDHQRHPRARGRRHAAGAGGPAPDRGGAHHRHRQPPRRRRVHGRARGPGPRPGRRRGGADRACEGRPSLPGNGARAVHLGQHRDRPLSRRRHQRRDAPDECRCRHVPGKGERAQQLPVFHRRHQCQRPRPARNWRARCGAGWTGPSSRCTTSRRSMPATAG
ncbi:MAG: PAS domain-containing protein [Comamonadaceae bacterium]|nr:PAS domain-containing protein [Comamonadaceae bacterium]